MDRVTSGSPRCGALGAVATLVLVAVLAVGCASSSTSTSAPGSTPPGSASGSADTTPDLVRTADAPPKDGGTLVYGLEAETDE